MDVPSSPTTAVKTQKNESSQTSTQTNEQGVPLINGKTQAEWDSSKGRDAEITTNLTNITQQNPSLLDNRAEFDKGFSYGTADEGKKAILDSFFKNAQKQRAIASTIAKYSSYSPNELGSMLSSTLLP